MSGVVFCLTNTRSEKKETLLIGGPLGLAKRQLADVEVAEVVYSAQGRLAAAPEGRRLEDTSPNTNEHKGVASPLGTSARDRQVRVASPLRTSA